MKYRAKITNCHPLIMNIRKYKDYKLIHTYSDIYIEIDNSQELLLIEDIEGYQTAILRKYQQLMELTNK